MFDDLAQDVASTLNGVFGGDLPYTRPATFTQDVPCVLRTDVELVDEHEQVVGRTNTLRIAHKDIAALDTPFVPRRGDTVVKDGETYTVGKRLADDGAAYLLEVST